MPVVVVGNVTFDTLYNTMFSYFYEQGCQMDTRVGSDGMQLNAAFFNLGSSIAVVFLTPVIEKAMRSTSGTFKVMCGIFMGAASQLVAAVIEYHRRQAEVLPIGSNCAPLKPGSFRQIRAARCGP